MNTTPAELQYLADRMDALGEPIVPRMESLAAECERVLLRNGKDAALAPILAKNLLHTYTKVLEVDFPELLAESGGVLPIDTSPGPAMQSWEQWQIEGVGIADWIDDDGQVAPSGTVKMSKSDGKFAEMGHFYDLNWFDLERAAAAGLSFSLPTVRQKIAREAHARWTNWVWLFGDAAKGLPGFANHPNIPRTLAPLNAGATSRLLADKSNDEVLADFATLIDSIPQNTLEKHHAVEVLIAPQIVRQLRARVYSTPNGGVVSLWDYIKGLYAGDDTGQGKVTFKMMNECDPDRRQNPQGGGDTSGINGFMMIAKPADNLDVGCFIRSRPFTQRAPEQRGFALHHQTHSRIGGAKIQEPLAFHVMVFAVGS